jgi:hypothetical protein
VSTKDEGYVAKIKKNGSSESLAKTVVFEIRSRLAHLRAHQAGFPEWTAEFTGGGRGPLRRISPRPNLAILKHIGNLHQ